MHEVLKKDSVDEIAAHRDRALAQFRVGQAALLSAAEAGLRAVQNSERYSSFAMSRRYSLAYPRDLDYDVFRRDLDRQIWGYLLEASKMRTVMGTKDVEKFERSIEGDDVPEATAANIYGTFQKMFASASTLFNRAVVDCFEGLPREYRTNNPGRFGKRVIFHYAYDPKWPRLYKTDHVGRLLYDLEKTMFVLDGQPVTAAGEIVPKVTASMPKIGENKPSPWVSETAYLRVKAYKKGTIHVEFVRQDIADRMNRILADHYGEALPRSKDEVDRSW